ncbi:MAG: hypothetical protein CV045_02790 [Cyanobacteria bacterium M5B4]|nr:MAG: hypothetical protein CV045_02790 [Cyanobacteria bacterium M5B4]
MRFLWFAKKSVGNSSGLDREGELIGLLRNVYDLYGSKDAPPLDDGKELKSTGFYPVKYGYMNTGDGFFLYPGDRGVNTDFKNITIQPQTPLTKKLGQTGASTNIPSRLVEGSSLLLYNPQTNSWSAEKKRGGEKDIQAVLAYTLKNGNFRGFNLPYKEFVSPIADILTKAPKMNELFPEEADKELKGKLGDLLGTDEKHVLNNDLTRLMFYLGLPVKFDGRHKRRSASSNLPKEDYTLQALFDNEGLIDKIAKGQKIIKNSGYNLLSTGTRTNNQVGFNLAKQQTWAIPNEQITDDLVSLINDLGKYAVPNSSLSEKTLRAYGL